MAKLTDEQYRATAKALHETNDRACVIPEDAKVEFNPEDPDGRYVEARIWISDAEVE